MDFYDEMLFVVKLTPFKGDDTHIVFDTEVDALFYADAEFVSGKFCNVSVFRGTHVNQRGFLEYALENKLIKFYDPIYQEGDYKNKR